MALGRGGGECARDYYEDYVPAFTGTTFVLSK